MKKIYRKLTDEQLKRGVIFSSRLLPDGTRHEVFSGDENKAEKIQRLKNDKFFNKSYFTANLIRS